MCLAAENTFSLQNLNFSQNIVFIMSACYNRIEKSEHTMKYLDLVELIKEKPAYTKAGVKVGDFGAVMCEKPIDGKWQVIFSEFYTGKDIADILVSEEDLKIYESIPKDRYPIK